MLEELILMLFICDHSVESEHARRNLDKIIREKCQHLGIQTKVIDIMDEPCLAETYNIIATPTLMRVLQDKQIRIIGDLSNTENVLNGIGVSSVTE